MTIETPNVMNIPTTICIDVMSTDKGEKMCCYDEVKPFDKEIDKATTNGTLNYDASEKIRSSNSELMFGM